MVYSSLRIVEGLVEGRLLHHLGRRLSGRDTRFSRTPNFHSGGSSGSAEPQCLVPKRGRDMYAQMHICTYVHTHNPTLNTP